MRIQSGYQLYSGTSSYAQPMVENIYSKGCDVFLNGLPGSGTGSVAVTMLFTDKYGTDYPIYTFAATSGQKVIFSLYPGLLGTSSATYQTLDAVLPEKYHLNMVTTGTINYQISVNELP